ncbi:Methyltransferase FkbM domain protein [uncultured archaeon]|nr:Methyltransferase FkbM domain protein [uncultured archaeon]
MIGDILLKIYFWRHTPKALRNVGRRIYAATGSHFLDMRKIQLNEVLAFYTNLSIIKKGDLVFDLGANKGIYSETFSRLGARVVAVEPQPECAKQIRALAEKYPGISVVEAGVSDTPGYLDLFIAKENVSSTFSLRVKDWAEGVEKVEYCGKIRVPMTTINELMGRYGAPDYCKLDIEGFEKKVLLTLGKATAIKQLSFEFHNLMMDDTVEIIKHLSIIGYNKFNFQVHGSDTAALELPNWKNGGEIIIELEKRCKGKTHIMGDVFASL